MVKRHLKRPAAPKTWPIPRKGTKWVVRPRPGPHKMEYSMPIALWIRDYLKYAKTLREVNYILKNKKCYVDFKPITDYKYPVGLFDVIYFPDLGEYWRVLINEKGKLYLKRIDEKEARIKPLRIKSKQMVKGGKVQLTLFDGRNVLVDDPKKYKTGDTLVFDLIEKKVIEHIPLEEGVKIYFIDGANVGKVGTFKELIIRHTLHNTRVVKWVDEQGNLKETSAWDYFVVVGREKPIISL